MFVPKAKYISVSSIEHRLTSGGLRKEKTQWPKATLNSNLNASCKKYPFKALSRIRLLEE